MAVAGAAVAAVLAKKGLDNSIDLDSDDWVEAMLGLADSFYFRVPQDLD